MCLFLSYLKAEFHGVKITIEAYSNKTKQDEVEDLEAKGGIVAGLTMGKGKEDRNLVRKFRVIDVKSGVDL